MSEPKIHFDIEVAAQGNAEVQKLASEIKNLGNRLDVDLRSQAVLAAEALHNLGSQNKVASDFAAIQQSVSQAGAAFQQANAKLKEINVALAEASRTAGLYAIAENNKRASMQETARELGAAKIALAQVDAAYDKAGRNTAQYSQATGELKVRIAQLNDELREDKNQLQAASQAAKQAERDANALATQSQKLSSDVGLLGRELNKANAALVESEARLSAAGIDAAKFSVEQARLADETAHANAAVIGFANAFRELSAQEAAAVQSARARAAEEDRLAAIVAASRQRMENSARAEADGILRDAARVEEAHRRTKAQLDQAAATAAAAGQRIKEAFSTLGVRSADELQAKIAEVRAAMETIRTQSGLTGSALNTAMGAGNAQIAALQTELRKVSGEMTLMEKAASAVKTGLGGITAGNVIANGISMIASKAAELGAAFVKTNVEADSMRRALEAIYKDVGIAASQMDFLRKSSIASGISISDLGTDFTKFSAATKTSSITLQESNAMFSALTKAAGTLGLSSSTTSSALSALSQVASKGTVAMEELRGQLGEHIPGALAITAKGLGITEKELINMVSAGDLAARDFFPAFTKGLKELHGETNGLANTWANFKNILDLSAISAGNNGGLLLMTSALKIFGAAIGIPLLALNTFLAGLHSLVNVSIFVRDVFTKSLPDALNIFSESSRKITDELNLQSAGFTHFLFNTNATREAVEKATNANQKLAESGSKTTVELSANSAALAELAVKARSSIAGVEALALVTKLSGDKAIDASNNFVQLKEKMNDLITKKIDQIKVSEKASEAADLEGEALIRLAKLSGDNAAVLEVTAKAAEKSAQAMEKVAVAREAVAATLAIELDELKKLAIAQDGSLEKRKDEIKAIEKRLEQADKEAAAARAAADNSRNEAIAKDIATKANKDNSNSVEELRIAMGAANIALKQAIELEQQGAATKEDVTKASEKAAKASALYRDSLNDLINTINKKNAEQQAESRIVLAGLDSQKVEIENSIAIAKLKGDEAEATRLNIEKKKIEIKVIEETVAAQIKEAEADIEVATAKMKELALSKDFDVVKQGELVTQIKIAEAKIKEAENRGKAIEGIYAEIAVLAKYTDELNRKIQKMNEENSVKKAESDLISSGLNWRKSELEAEIKIAESKGDTLKVTKLTIEQKRVEIEIIRESVREQIREAEAALEVAKAKKSELIQSGMLTPAMRSELDSTIASNEAKIKEAKSRGESVRLLELEIKTLKESTSGYQNNVSSINQTTAALEAFNKQKEREISAQEKANELKQREIDLYNKKWKMDAEHNSVDENGKKIESTIETQQSLYNKAIDAGLSPSQAKQIADIMAPSNGGFADMNAFLKEVNSIKQQNDLNAEIIQKIGQKIQDGTATGMDLEAFKNAGGTPPPPKPTSTQPPMELPKNQGTVPVKEAPKQQAPTSVVNLHYNGQSVGSVATDPAGANALDAFMRQLEMGQSNWPA